MLTANLAAAIPPAIVMPLTASGMENGGESCDQGAANTDAYGIEGASGESARVLRLTAAMPS